MRSGTAKYLTGLLLLLASSSPQAGTTTYSYDDAGRLISVSLDSAPPQAYGYDARGNILSVATPLPPGAPTAVSARAADTQAIVSFTAPADKGSSDITAYTATCNPGGVSAANSISPITVTGLSNGLAYACSVTASNSAGTGPASALSNSVTPLAPPASFTVSTNSGPNGSISPAVRTVTSGTTTTFTVTADAGYSASATGCDGNLDGTSFTTGMVTADCTVSASFTRSSIQAALTAGWNLLGNGMDAPLAVASVFGDPGKVVTVWKWEPSGTNPGVAYPAWAFYTPLQDDGGAAYAAARGYDFLTTVKGAEGFWVNAKAPFAATLPASTPIASTALADRPSPSNNALPRGWSLVAVGDGPTPRALVNAIALTPPAAPQVAATSLTTLWAWDSTLTNWYFYSPSLDNTPGALTDYITAKGLLDFAAHSKTLGNAAGFWVNTP